MRSVGYGVCLVEGASESPVRFRNRRIVEVRAPPTALRVAPSPLARGGRMSVTVLLISVTVSVTFGCESNSPKGRRRVTRADRGETVPAGGVVTPAPGRTRV